MSFLKRLTSEFNELKAKLTDDDDKPVAEPQTCDAQRGQADSYYGQQSPSRQGYGGPPQQQNQGGSPSTNQHPPGAAQCPPGWSAQWDTTQQRWYYIDPSTGRSSWDPPMQGSTPGYGGAPAAYGSQHGYPPQKNAGQSYAPYGGQPAEEMQAPYASETKEKGKSNAMLYGAGGLAAGALAGGLIVHELGEDDDDEQRRAAESAPQQNYGQPQPYGEPTGQPQYAGDQSGPPPEVEPPAVLPAADADGDSVSSSDREDVQEARDNYEDELAEASPGSSDDAEDVQEAREEYEEAYEETYEE
ncbi:hypothetical protein LTR85_009740 [Meristemomyces frigidus]|nr:hypothetical protein LTR85_009740 [Meristemomyces frigidus]